MLWNFFYIEPYFFSVINFSTIDYLNSAALTIATFHRGHSGLKPLQPRNRARLKSAPTGNPNPRLRALAEGCSWRRDLWMTFREHCSLLMPVLDNPFLFVHLSFRLMPRSHKRHQCPLMTQLKVSNGNVIWTWAFTVLSGGMHIDVTSNPKKPLFLVVAKA